MGIRTQGLNSRLERHKYDSSFDISEASSAYAKEWKVSWDMYYLWPTQIVGKILCVTGPTDVTALLARSRPREVHALVVVFDYGYVVGDVLEELKHRTVDFETYTGSRTLFNVVANDGTTAVGLGF